MIGSAILLCGSSLVAVCMVFEGINAMLSPEPQIKAITFEQWRVKN